MLWWELTPRNRHPVVNFRILRIAACGLHLPVRGAGFGLYGGVFIFPLFTQSLLHFTPTETGLALLPGGLATATTALICGRLLTGARPLVEPRVLIAIGVAVFVAAMGIRSSHHRRRRARRPACAHHPRRGARLPLHADQQRGVCEPRAARGATGGRLINLARQLGGSFGIAILATYITVHTQIHRVDLIANVYPGQRLVDERVQALTANLIRHGYGPDAAHRGAIALLDQQVMREASC